jgi:RNA polymerase sigma factor (TIGR02999 family)
MPDTGPEQQITECLRRVSDGDQNAVDDLFRMLYPQLRQMADNAMRRQRPDHTLQPTALVNEAVTKLLTGSNLEGLADRRAFFAFASLTMRAVLVDHARRRSAAKRPSGGDRSRIALDQVVESFGKNERIDLLALDEALEELKRRNQRHHDIVNLHFFGGLSFREIAEHLDVSLSTVEKDWRMARAWLLTQLDSGT